MGIQTVAANVLQFLKLCYLLVTCLYTFTIAKGCTQTERELRRVLGATQHSVLSLVRGKVHLYLCVV